MARYQVDWKDDHGLIIKTLFTSADTSDKAINNTRHRLRGFGYEPNNYHPYATLVPYGKPNPQRGLFE